MKILKGLIPFWSDELFDKDCSDAVVSVNKPRRDETVITFDNPWEGNGTDFGSIIKDDGFFRFYYQTWSNDYWYGKGELCINVCYAESKDGIHWTRPMLNLIEFNGSTDNNIIVGKIPDNFSVMKDPNPGCSPDMKYKALKALLNIDYRDGNVKNMLGLYTSSDGIHFKQHSIISTGLAYDSQNTLHYDRHSGKYFCYMRYFDFVSESEDIRMNEKHKRNIAVMESEDLIHWTEPVKLEFGDGERYPLYTNCISAYPYDDRYYVGFPSRYVERREWNKNYDRLCGKELRLQRSGVEGRLGRALTDCVFMFSEDKYNWTRFDEAVITPGIESGNNWIYGDCFPAIGGLIPTKSDVEGESDELSLYVFKHHWMNIPTELVRYVYRKDGMASLKAPYKSKRAVTKPFMFEGNTLRLNFSTSARGGIYIRILDTNNELIDGYSTYEIFGDSTDRIIDFDAPLSDLNKKAIKLEFTLSDAEIFSIKFE